MTARPPIFRTGEAFEIIDPGNNPRVECHVGEYLAIIARRGVVNLVAIDFNAGQGGTAVLNIPPDSESLR